MKHLSAVCKDSYVVYCLWFWHGVGKKRMICRISENHYKHSDLHAISVIWPWTIEETKPYFFMWFSAKLFWGNSWWFMNHSEIILGQFLKILSDLQISLKLLWGDSQWFVNHCEIIFWSDSWWFSVILGDSQVSLKSFLGVILGDL